MKKKEAMLVSIPAENGTELVGVLWSKDSVIDPHEYNIRLFESPDHAFRYADSHPQNRGSVIFRMIVNTPVELPPAPADLPAQATEASNEESNTP